MIALLRCRQKLLPCQIGISVAFVHLTVHTPIFAIAPEMDRASASPEFQLFGINVKYLIGPTLKLFPGEAGTQLVLIPRDRNFILARPKVHYVVPYLFASASSRQRPANFYKIL